MRSIICIFLALVSLFAISISAHADTHHLYVSGTVSSRTDDTLTVGKQTFFRDDLTEIVILFKENDAIHEREGNVSDFWPGTPVTVKVTGNRIEEIIVERWKE